MTDYYANFWDHYNHEVQVVRSVRIPITFNEKVNNALRERGTNFNKYVKNMLATDLTHDIDDNNLPEGDVLIIQDLLHATKFLMDFFQKNADVLRDKINDKERKEFIKIAEMIDKYD